MYTVPDYVHTPSNKASIKVRSSIHEVRVRLEAWL